MNANVIVCETMDYNDIATCLSDADLKHVAKISNPEVCNKTATGRYLLRKVLPCFFCTDSKDVPLSFNDNGKPFVDMLCDDGELENIGDVFSSLVDTGKVVYKKINHEAVAVSKFFFNISHSKGLVAFVFGDKECGVDIEKIGEYKPAVAERYFFASEYEYIESLKEETDKQLAFCRLWTIKECILKKYGLSLLDGLQRIRYDCERSILYFDNRVYVADIATTVLTHGSTRYMLCYSG